MSIEKPHHDGAGSYCYIAKTCTYRSFFAQPDYIYNDMATKLGDSLSDSPGKHIRVVSFNRI